MVVYQYQCILMKYEQNGIHWAHRCHEYNPTVLNHEKTRFIVHASSEGHGPTKGCFLTLFTHMDSYGCVYSRVNGLEMTSHPNMLDVPRTLGKY